MPPDCVQKADLNFGSLSDAVLFVEVYVEDDLVFSVLRIRVKRPDFKTSGILSSSDYESRAVGKSKVNSLFSSRLLLVDCQAYLCVRCQVQSLS